MATNTIYNPQRTSEFVKDNLQFAGKSIYFEAVESSTAYFDFLLTDDVLLTGGRLLVQGGNIHDKISLQIIHPVYGVVNEFVTGYRVSPDVSLQLDLTLDYPAKLSAGLSIRCKYESNADTGTRQVAYNMYLHKVLV